jgi:hypothetical protein
MRIPILAGRAFNSAEFSSAEETNAIVTAADEEAAKASASSGAHPASSHVKSSPPTVAPVPVIINETFARRFFQKQDPIGMHMGNAENDDPHVVLHPGYRIVGITGDTKYRDLKREIRPAIYTPLVGSHAYFELRTTGDPTALGKRR